MIGTVVLGTLAWAGLGAWYFWPAYGPRLVARWDRFQEVRLVHHVAADPYKLRRLYPLQPPEWQCDEADFDDEDISEEAADGFAHYLEWLRKLPLQVADRLPRSSVTRAREETD